MTMNESAENYLETILVLSHSLPVVRSVDIANEMGFKKSSVSVAMKNLRENGYILVSDSGFITLTDSGMEIAEMIYERHTLLSTWLETLGVDKEIAAQDACPLILAGHTAFCRNHRRILFRMQQTIHMHRIVVTCYFSSLAYLLL